VVSEFAHPDAFAWARQESRLTAMASRYFRMCVEQILLLLVVRPKPTSILSPIAEPQNCLLQLVDTVQALV
jgi:hypothetical protein